MVAHVLADVGPHREQHALALVVAGAILVGQAEIPGHDRAVDGADDLAERDLFRRAGQDVTAPDAALGADEPGTFQREQDLLQIGLGETGPLGDVADRGRRELLAQGQGEQGAACIVPTRRYLHVLNRTAVGDPICGTRRRRRHGGAGDGSASPPGRPTRIGRCRAAQVVAMSRLIASPADDRVRCREQGVERA